MSRVESLIDTIEIELLKKGKNYFTLGQANNLLFEKGKITKEEKKEGYLKLLLVNNQIKNAQQTETKPRQWRIFLSQEKVQKRDNYNRKFEEENTSWSRRNDKVGKSKSISSGSSNSRRNWIIGGVIFLFFIYIYNENNSDYGTNGSQYVITDNTYAATSKENYDQMFEYISYNDEYAVKLMILQSQVKILEKGVNIILIENHFSYSIVRETNSYNKFWVVSDHIGK